MPGPTEKLFHHDAYQKSFDARVQSCQPAEADRFRIVLDRTIFYADAGGQPHDTGRLGGGAVRDVIDEDGTLVHLVDRPLEGAVEGEIDWPRRFDHMQQHTGQHILSQAFILAAAAETVSFHMGSERSTIDVALGEVTDAAAAAAESLANRIVQEDREILAHWTTLADIGRFPLRRPPKVEGAIRVIEVKDFDFSACGGTHVARAGEVGLIKVLRRERYKGGTRIEFLCGGRALADYAWKHDLVKETADRFSTLDRDLGGAIQRLEDEARDLRRRLRELEEEKLDREADELARTATAGRGFQVVMAQRAIDGAESLKALAVRLRSRPGLAVFLGGTDADGRAHLIFARSDDVAGDASRAIKAALPLVEGRGGGRAEMAQGSGPAGANLKPALDAGRRAFEESPARGAAS